MAEKQSETKQLRGDVGRERGRAKRKRRKHAEREERPKGKKINKHYESYFITTQSDDLASKRHGLQQLQPAKTCLLNAKITENQ